MAALEREQKPAYGCPAHFMHRKSCQFPEPRSKEANAMRRAHLAVVETPAPVASDEEETVDVPTLSDAELLAD